MRINLDLLNLLISVGVLVGSPVAVQGNVAAEPKKVAFIISENFNMIDFAGPWEVLQDANRDGNPLFQLYTVSEATAPVHSTGGAVMTPQYTFATAPQPDIIFVGAQANNSKALLDWIRKGHRTGSTVVSVCTGARKLALSGLIDGLPATTHHDFLEEFRKAFPNVKWQSNRRFVKAADRIYSAGGLTSGIDLALHIVAETAGSDVAKQTAFYMEYSGEGWKETCANSAVSGKVLNSQR
jgi:transcriptional regulator GlxA family with amidase domain